MSDDYITIALLNVRSIVPKIPDIHHDSSLKCANILCFTETWLTSAQATPVLYDDHTISSRNRLSGDNKGGVMISLPCTMRPSNITEFSFTGILIEAVSSTLVLPNGERLQITLVYRSPSVSTDIMLNVIEGILGQITVRDIPSIVLGDFNEDLLTIPDSKLLHLMSHYGFSQFVKRPTTDRGTLIDHVYYNRPSNHIRVQVQDTYYSDHDTVYCSLPLSHL